MRKFSPIAMLAAACGLLGGCDNTRANPAERVTVESPSRQSTLAPGVAPTLAPIVATLVRSNSYADDINADGIAETRTIETWTYDPAIRRCTQTTEIDFDADGTIDSRSIATTSLADPASC